jgi:PTH1 family peptidyl-tRNA hydrolase
MYYIVGLGNPGEEYVDTRHNIGRMAVEVLAKAFDASWKSDSALKLQKAKVDIADESATLILPDTYMNKSGAAVAPYIVGEKASGSMAPDMKKKVEKKASKLIVIQDDLDMPIGKIKIVSNRGSGGHRGIESIKRAYKNWNFTRDANWKS